MRAERIKSVRQARRVRRVRKKISGVAQRPRLAVSRSHRSIYAQIIDDSTGRTLCAASSQGKELRGQIGYGGNRQAAAAVGKALGEKARGLGIDERVYGPTHPKVATDVNNLGSVLYAQGDLAGARGCCERALGIWRVAYGEDHPQVATAHNNLGMVLQDQGDLAGARGCFERALGIFEKFLPEGHPDIEWARGSLESLGR